MSETKITAMRELIETMQNELEDTTGFYSASDKKIITSIIKKATELIAKEKEQIVSFAEWKEEKYIRVFQNPDTYYHFDKVMADPYIKLEREQTFTTEQLLETYFNQTP